MADFSVLYLLGYALILLGLVGVILPLVPGPLLIWLGALVWAWGDGFARVNWVVLAVLGVLAALAWASDILLTTAMSRRSGVSWKAIGGAVVGGLVGGLLLVEIPIIGTLFGALLMAALRNGCNMIGIPNYVQNIVIGAVIIGAVAADRLRHR